MAEHRIRFRAGWERADPNQSQPSDRLTLPILQPIAGPSPVRLLRRFGRPSFDPIREAVRLEFRGVPGLAAAWLNSAELGRPDAAATDWVVPLLVPLLSRNLLELELDLNAIGELYPAEGWGTIALVISSRSGWGVEP
jgi:hypothetical protein